MPYFRFQSGDRIVYVFAANSNEARQRAAASGNPVNPTSVLAPLPDGQAPPSGSIDVTQASDVSGPTAPDPSLIGTGVTVREPEDRPGTTTVGKSTPITSPNQNVGVSVPPGSLGPGPAQVQPAAAMGNLELQSPFGAFTNFLSRFAGLGSGDPRSAARTFAESQFSPLRAAFGGQQLATGIDPAAEGFGNEFAQFLNQGGINPRQRLGDAFRSLQTAAPGADPQGFLGQALNAQTANEAAEIFNLARNLQGSRISPLISSRFSQPTNEELFGRFAGGRQAGSGLNALDFARRQFGLGQLGF